MLVLTNERTCVPDFLTARYLCETYRAEREEAEKVIGLENSGNHPRKPIEGLAAE